MIDCHTSLKRARLTRKETGTHITVQRSSDTDNAAVDLSSMEHSIASLNSALVPLQYFELVPWGRHSAAVTGTLQKIVEDFRKANGGPGDLRCEIVHVELVPQTWRQTRRRPEEDKAKNKAGDKRALVAVAAVLEADQKKTKQVLWWKSRCSNISEMIKGSKGDVSGKQDDRMPETGENMQVPIL